MTLDEDTGGIRSSRDAQTLSGPSHMTVSEESRSVVSSTSPDEAIIAKNDSSKGSDSQHIGSPQSFHSTNCTVESARVSGVVNSEVCIQAPPPISTPQLDSCMALPMELGQIPQERPPSPKQLKTASFGSDGRSLDFRSCLDISQSLKSFLDLLNHSLSNNHTPRGFLSIESLAGNFHSNSLDLTKQDEDRYQEAADRLFAVNQFHAAGHIYSFLLLAEESKTFQRIELSTRGILTPQPPQATRMLTPRAVAAFRSARSIPQLKLVQDILLQRLESDLLVRRSLPQDQTHSVSERFLVNQFLEDCYRRQGSASEESGHLRRSSAIADQLNREGDPWLKRNHAVLLYLYYKNAFPELPSPRFINVVYLKSLSRYLGPHGASSISYEDFMVFWVQVRNHAQGKEAAWLRDDIPNHRILTCVRGCVSWCGSINKDIRYEIITFERMQDIWDARQEGATVLQHPPCLAMVPETDLGISTSEHLHICALILSSISGAKGVSDMSDQELVDLYLRLLYSRISTNIGQQATTQGTGDPSSRDSIAPSIAPSHRSSDASLRNFRAVSQSMKQRVGEVPSTEARGSYGLGSLRHSSHFSHFSHLSHPSHSSHSSHFSHLSHMSHLSDLFERTSIREEDTTDAFRLAHERASNMAEGFTDIPEGLKRI